MESREIVAYAIVAVMLVAALGWIAVTAPRRRAEALRRRGIKSYRRD